MNSQQLRSHAELCRRLADCFDLKDIRDALHQSAERHLVDAAEHDLTEWRWSDNEPS